MPDRPDGEFERVASKPLQWESTGDFEQSYAVVLDGERWTCGMGEFPVEPLYLIWIDGEPTDSVDDWPSAWEKPRPVE